MSMSDVLTAREYTATAVAVTPVLWIVGHGRFTAGLAAAATFILRVTVAPAVWVVRRVARRVGYRPRHLATQRAIVVDRLAWARHAPVTRLRVTRWWYTKRPPTTDAGRLEQVAVSTALLAREAHDPGVVAAIGPRWARVIRSTITRRRKLVP